MWQQQQQLNGNFSSQNINGYQQQQPGGYNGQQQQQQGFTQQQWNPQQQAQMQWSNNNNGGNPYQNNLQGMKMADPYQRTVDYVQQCQSWNGTR